jgi:hypothetical protein
MVLAFFSLEAEDMGFFFFFSFTVVVVVVVVVVDRLGS